MSSTQFSGLWLLSVPIAAMTLVVAASNILVQYPVTAYGLQDYLTLGAFTYPIAFLVTDLTNRRFGLRSTRQVILVGFLTAVLLSVWLATPRIALASGTAFLVSQCLDVTVYDRLRRLTWWRAPLLSSLIGSFVDTTLFFTLAFAGSDIGSAHYGPFVLPVWLGWAVVDFLVKCLFALGLLAPYRALMPLVTQTNAGKGGAAGAVGS